MEVIVVANDDLYTNVTDQLHFEPNIDEANITISIKDKGIVVLGGKVKSYSEKYLAEKAIEKVRRLKESLMK